MTKASHLPFTCCLLPGQEESTRLMSERGSRAVANEEELKVMERSKVDLKEQPMDEGASRPHKPKPESQLQSLWYALSVFGGVLDVEAMM